MDRFIFVGDVHFSSVQYGTRLDNSLGTLMRKIEYALSYADRMRTGEDDYPVVVFTGDFLNGNNNSTQSLVRLIDMMVPYADNLLCYTIGGNHELKGDDYKSLDDSQLQLLFRSHVMSFLGEGEDILCGRKTTLGLVRGWSAYSELDASNAEMVIGLVCHHFLSASSPDPLSADIDSLIATFPNLRFIVAGHDHACYPIQDYRGVKIIRPGSLLRVSSAADSDRQPCFAEMVVDEDFSVAVRYVPVPALAYGDAFDLEGKRTRKGVKDSAAGIADAFIDRFGNPLGLSASLEDVFSRMMESVPSEHKGMVRADLADNGWVVP